MIGEDMGKSKVPHFLSTMVYIYISNCKPSVYKPSVYKCHIQVSKIHVNHTSPFHL